MATNKPQHEYMKTALRLPSPLHVKLHEAAALSGRSYNAEIVSRLEGSFRPEAESSSDSIALLFANAQSRFDMLSVRGDVIKSRRDTVLLRQQLLLDEADRIVRNGSTDDNVQPLAEIKNRVLQLEEEAQTLSGEVEELTGQREAVAVEASSLKAMLVVGQSVIEGLASRSEKAVLVGNLGTASPSIYDEFVRAPDAAPRKSAPRRKLARKPST